MPLALNGDPQAQRRARELLLEYLAPAQRETFLAAGFFDVDKTGARRTPAMLLRCYPRFRVYRLSDGWRPVALFTSPRRLARCVPNYVYCINSPEHVPREDALLSLKLLLDHDEPRFVRIGHRFACSRLDRPLLPIGDPRWGPFQMPPWAPLLPPRRRDRAAADGRAGDFRPGGILRLTSWLLGRARLR